MTQDILAPDERNDGFPPPRKFQVDAHEKLRIGFRAGHKNQILMAPTGAGKTYLGLRICNEAIQRGKKAVFLCDRTTLINQTSAVADRYGIEHGIVQAKHWRRRPDELFQIASVQTVAKRQFWPQMDVLVVDECFPEDTLISTPNGLVEIHTIRSGDLIYNTFGIAKVKSTFSKTSNKLCKVRLSDGTNFRCTPDHPIFTGMGWKSAGSLGIGEKLFRIQGVQSLWKENFSKNGKVSQRESESSSGISIQKKNDLWTILCEEIEKSYAQSIIEGKNARNLVEDWSQTNCSRGQWTWDDINTAIRSKCARERLGGGICSEHEEINEGRISTSLQAGYSQCGYENCYRIGRSKSFFSETKRKGQEEGLLTAHAWVESVEIEESVCDEIVYNLRVEGHPSYFANGFLVHNCHTAYKAWTDFAMTTGATVIGLSATPFTAGLGKIFSNIVNATTMHDLTQEGVLVPMRVFSCHKPDMKGAETKGGEWTDKAAEERSLKIIGDVVSDWIKFGDNRKTIVFGSTIKHCEELCRQFIDQGIMAAVFTSETTMKEREHLLDEYRKSNSHLKILISVEALAKGFDVPDVGCICDARPLRKSLSTAIQIWGRGLRSSPETGKKDCHLLDFSGNIVRFFEDFNDIYFNGLEKLDDGDKLDKKIREAEEFESKGCPKCGYRPFLKRCMACGHEKVTRQIDESLPGHMQEIFIGTGSQKKKLADNAEHLWHQVCSYARIHSKPETQSGRAWHLFKKITGQETKWSFSKAPTVDIGKNVYNKIQQMNIAYKKGIGK